MPMARYGIEANVVDGKIYLIGGMNCLLNLSRLNVGYYS